MEAREERAEELHQEAIALSEGGDVDAALQKYKEALALDFSRATTHYNVGLIHKYRCEWKESFRYNKRAVELDPEDEASNWNLAIAATALGNWKVARSVWNRLGLSIELGSEPIEADFGVTPVRLNPDDDAEVVWAQRICPVRARILSIPYPDSGFRYGDVVLNDGAAVGYRMYRNNEHPVFNVLSLLTASPWHTYEAEIHASAEEDVEALEALCEEAGIEFEDWTASVRILCKQCSEGTPHEEHDEEQAQHWAERHQVGLAATDDSKVRQVLEAWQTETRGVERWELTLAGAQEP